ncbi:MAG: class I SAM-dependent methyltransferase [Acidobacteria bacterium]|nr:class I SAM-dependent methyltransferase [Acidobacteriota bacterium]
MNIPQAFGNIDIYLFDQLMKGRIAVADRVLDAGCGSGRNAHYLLRESVDVYGVDENPPAVAAFAELAAELGHPLQDGRARQAALDALPFDQDYFDVVICSAVLHFARDDQHFEDMVAELFRVLRPGGLFFSRLASSAGIESQVQWLSGRRAYLPDGSERYLVNEAQLMALTAAHGQLLDPLKTTIVHGQRAMTTWVVRKITSELIDSASCLWLL